MIRLKIRDPRWTSFVAGCRDARPFHHPAWTQLLAECYGFRPFALALTDPSGRVTAGLPVLEVRGLTSVRRWVSLPFTDYCPPLTAEGVDRGGLVRHLDAVRRAARVSAIEVRAPLTGPGSHTSAGGVLHTSRLEPDSQVVYRTFHRSQVQRNIGRAEREGVTVRWGASRADLLDVFYDFHVRTRQRQGTPVQPRRFFDLVWRRLIEPGLGFVLLAYAGDAPIAGAVFLHWNGTVTYKFGASEPAWWKLRPNHLIFWTAIRWACENGYHTFDWGRTELDNSGLREFKSGWGASEEVLVYSSLAERPPSHGSRRLAEALGTVVRRSPPWVCRALGEVLYRYAA